MLLPVRKAISLSCDAHFPLSISHNPHNRHIPGGGGDEEGEKEDSLKGLVIQ